MVPSQAPVFLIYFDDLSSCLEKTASRMYTDDTNIIFDVSDLSVLEREIIAIEENYLWLMAKNSSPDIAKTELMLIGTLQYGCNAVGKSKLELQGGNINQIEKAKTLGVLIWDKLTGETTQTKFLKGYPLDALGLFLSLYVTLPQRISTKRFCMFNTAQAQDKVPEVQLFTYSGGDWQRNLLQGLRGCDPLGFLKMMLKTYYSSLGSHTAIM